MKPLKTSTEWLALLIKQWGKFDVNNVIPTEDSPKAYSFMIDSLLAMADDDKIMQFPCSACPAEFGCVMVCQKLEAYDEAKAAIEHEVDDDLAAICQMIAGAVPA